MCGICGILRTDRSPVDPDQLGRMNEALRHRGPDGDGRYLAPGVGLAMRRLAIIDLDTGDQPIPNEDASVWIVFNGEIFNFPRLRVELEERGHYFRTRTDTECILHLYEDYGEDCVHHLRGQFAFAIWDQVKQLLLIARDRFGQKPLYYCMQNGILYFSSELTSLLGALPQKPEVDLSAIDLYLSLQYIPEPQTPYVGVHKLPAAHRLIAEDGKVHLERYWQLDFGPKHKASEHDLTEELKERMLEAVRIRMISDVPLGAHLSGGIDSSIVVAMMAEASDRPVKTFSVGFEEAAFSELSYARQVAERYETDHHEFTLTFGNIPVTLKHLVHHFGEPFGDPSAIPLFHLSRLTREHVTVALNGDGGDEAFAGYQRYWLDPWANMYANLPDWFTQKFTPWFVRLLPDTMEAPVGSSLVNGLKRLQTVAQIHSGASILRWGSYFSPQWKTRLWRQAPRDRAEAILVAFFEAAEAKSFLDRTLSTDISSYLPGDLLVKADRMTMANSLEGRSPFLDHELAAWAARLPGELKVRRRTGKYLLRKAFADKLPPAVGRRGKQGFGIPVGAWFRGPLSDWAGQVLIKDGAQLHQWFEPDVIQALLDEHRSGKENHGKRIYALVMLSLWTQDFM